MALVLGEHCGDPTIVGIEQFGEVAVGEQTTLLVSLLAQAEGPAKQALGDGKAIDPLVDVVGGGEVEKDGDQLGVSDLLAVGGWVR